MHASTGWDYGNWITALISIALFGYFVWGGLRPRKPREWRSLGLVSAFLVALFAEMYGVPLTIYVLSATVWPALAGGDAFLHVNGHLLGTLLGLPTAGKLFICLLGGLLAMFGLIYMWTAWRTLHGERQGLVTEGPYADVRHPQYTGLALFIIGMLVQWPTLLTLLMAPLLLLRYARLAHIEEREMLEQFGEAYKDYRRTVPAFLPPIRRRHPVPGVRDPEPTGRISR